MAVAMEPHGELAVQEARVAVVHRVPSAVQGHLVRVTLAKAGIQMGISLPEGAAAQAVLGCTRLVETLREVWV